MNELELNNLRIERLKAAIEKISRGNKSMFGKRLGYADGAFVRQMITGLRPISEKTIRAIEALPGMAGWFEELAGSEESRRGDPLPQAGQWPFPSVPEQDVRALDPQQLEKLQIAMTAAIAAITGGIGSSGMSLSGLLESSEVHRRAARQKGSQKEKVKG